MKIDPVLLGIQRKQDANGVTMQLSGIEAGFLRAAAYEYSDGDRLLGFMSSLYNELDRYAFPEYDRKHPNWKDAADREVKRCKCCDEEEDD